LKRIMVGAVALALLSGCAGTPAADPAPAPAPPETSSAAEQSEPAAATPAGTLDACALVTKEEAEQLAGTPLEPGVPGDPAEPSCTYTGPVTGPTAQVEVYTGAGAQKILEIDRSLGHEFTPLTGIGDEAHAEEGAVFVAKSGVWVAIRLVRLDDPEIYRERLADLARTVADRL
jgi:hypothetical protein